MTLTFDLDLETFHEKKGLVQLCQFVEGGVNRVSSIGVVVENDAKNRCCQTNKQTYEQTNLQTNRLSNINGFRHLIKYGVIFNFFQNQTS